SILYIYFLLNEPPTTSTYTLSLHDALPIFTNPVNVYEVQLVPLVEYHTLFLPAVAHICPPALANCNRPVIAPISEVKPVVTSLRSEEHTSELQSLRHLVCRLLLEKKKPKSY